MAAPQQVDRQTFLANLRQSGLVTAEQLATAAPRLPDSPRGRVLARALEYVNGPNLDQLVRDKGPLPVGQACDFVRQVAHGLQYAHQLGMVHRDVKPANLLLQQGGADGQGKYGVVKVSDFGLARLSEQ